MPGSLNGATSAQLVALLDGRVRLRCPACDVFWLGYEGEPCWCCPRPGERVTAVSLVGR
jgi:hypothetical protein